MIFFVCFILLIFYVTWLIHDLFLISSEQFVNKPLSSCKIHPNITLFKL